METTPANLTSPKKPRTPSLTLTAPKEFDPLEKIHQERLIALCDQHAQMLRGPWKDLARIWHAANGGKREIEVAVSLKKQGVRKGVVDLHLDLSRHNYTSLKIELKRFRSGAVTEDEKDWLTWYAQNGCRSVVCWGWRAAWEELLWYLDLPTDGQPRPQTEIVSVSPYFVRKQRC